MRRKDVRGRRSPAEQGSALRDEFPPTPPAATQAARAETARHYSTTLPEKRAIPGVLAAGVALFRTGDVGVGAQSVPSLTYISVAKLGGSDW